MKNIYLHSLGCEKNTVDGEHILAILERNGFQVTYDAQEADVIVINTCGFIEDSKKESIDAIFNHTVFRKYGRCKRLIVSGCLSERYKNEFMDMFQEVDAAIGIHDLENILKAVEEDGFHDAEDNTTYKEYVDRVNTGSKYSVYIRISDGCHANCSFCAIPKIRGNHRSRKIEDIVSEAKRYAEQGAKEINLIAHETTFYGYDIYNKMSLPELLEEISKIDGIEWIRVLYQNPIIINDEVIESMFKIKKVVPYFDIPMQHVDKEILLDMNRGNRGEEFYKKMIDKIRNFDENAVIRTSFIVGFPGESPESFKKLVKFVRDTRLDRVGVFTYSREENTDAMDVDKKQLSRQRKEVLREKLMRVAIDVSEERLSRFIGKTVDVLIEKEEDGKFIGRTKYDAPDVDGYVEVYNDTDDNLKEGDIVKVNITHNTEYDLIGNYTR